MRIILNILFITFLYISIITAIALITDIDTALKWKWPVCFAFIAVQFLYPRLVKRKSPKDDEILKELKLLKDNATDIVPENNDEFIKWLTEDEGTGWKRVDPEKFKNVTFELAPQDKVDTYDYEIRLMLTYMLDPEDHEIAESALITDESMIFDFFWGDNEEKLALGRLKSVLGEDVGIAGGDYLWAAVDKIKNVFPNWPNNLSKLKLVKS